MFLITTACIFQFYSAVVENIDPRYPTVVVHFLEYGNSEEVSLSDVRPDPQFMVGTYTHVKNINATYLLSYSVDCLQYGLFKQENMQSIAHFNSVVHLYKINTNFDHTLLTQWFKKKIF